MNTSALLRSDLIHSNWLRRVLPAWFKEFLKSRIPYADYCVEQLRRWAEQRFEGPVPLVSDVDSPVDVRLGIFFDNSFTFAFHVAACRELQVRYRVIDLLADDWYRRVTDSDCNAFLASPPTLRGIWRRVSEERLWVIAHDMKIPLYPTFEELFIWESKRRMRDWLTVHQVPHPRTWVFLDRREALEFCRTTRYPVVVKTDSGAASSGIFVVRGSRQAFHLVHQAFNGGIRQRSRDERESEDGCILFQQYVPHDHEWRIVRIGNWYMCRKKQRQGDFASGSGDIGWAAPPPGMLDFVREVTDLGDFRSMGVDLFEDPERRSLGAYLVNELQTLVGEIVREDNVNEATGRWCKNPETAGWEFEPGYFYHNACANLRVVELLRRIGKPLRDGETGLQGSKEA